MNKTLDMLYEGILTTKGRTKATLMGLYLLEDYWNDILDKNEPKGADKNDKIEGEID